jgi:hypothetical protein
MNSFEIGQTVFFSGQRGTVISTAAGRGGKHLFVVRLASGAEIKADARSLQGEAVFAPPDPTALTRPIRDSYGDQRRMFRR